jgi:hypothetical protein
MQHSRQSGLEELHLLHADVLKSAIPRRVVVKEAIAHRRSLWTGLTDLGVERVVLALDNSPAGQVATGEASTLRCARCNRRTSGS